MNGNMSSSMPAFTSYISAVHLFSRLGGSFVESHINIHWYVFRCHTKSITPKTLYHFSNFCFARLSKVSVDERLLTCCVVLQCFGHFPLKAHVCVIVCKPSWSGSPAWGWKRKNRVRYQVSATPQLPTTSWILRVACYRIIPMNTSWNSLRRCWWVKAYSGFILFFYNNVTCPWPVMHSSFINCNNVSCGGHLRKTIMSSLSLIL